MPDLAAISVRVTSALADAEAHGAMAAAEVLRVDIVGLLRVVRHAEPQPTPVAADPQPTPVADDPQPTPVAAESDTTRCHRVHA